MAAFVHFECGSTDSRDAEKSGVLCADITWARTVTTPGILDVTAGNGSPALRVTLGGGAQDIWVAYGKNPDLSGVNSPRRLVTADKGQDDFFLKPGDKIAWGFVSG